MKSVLVTSALVCWVAAGCAHLAKIPADGEINGQPVRLDYDTGAAATVLDTTAAPRLGFTISAPPPGYKPPPGTVAVATTDDPCLLKIGAETNTLHPYFYHWPWYVHLRRSLSDNTIDGVIGWPDMKDNILVIDGSGPSLRKIEQVPPETADWLKLPLYSGSQVLALEISHTNDQPGVLTIDTGSDHDVGLPPDRWQEWKAAHRRAPSTLKANFMPGSGLTLNRLVRADLMKFGPITLTNVWVREANRTETRINGPAAVFEGCLGLGALKRLNLIVDGKNGVAYIQPKTAAPAVVAPWVK